MERTKIVIVLGTAREDSFSKYVADYLVETFRKRDGVEIIFVKVEDFLFGRTIPSWVESEVAEPWRKIAQEADGFLLVVPEYNRSFPGELKILLDSAYPQYRKKAVAIAGVSSGDFAGTRVIEHIQPIMTELGLAISPRPIHAPLVEELFDESGEVRSDRKEMFDKNIEASFDSLLWYSQALKNARQV